MLKEYKKIHKDLVQGLTKQKFRGFKYAASEVVKETHTFLKGFNSMDLLEAHDKVRDL